jgi:hypothetical protein
MADGVPRVIVPNVVKSEKFIPFPLSTAVTVPVPPPPPPPTAAITNAVVANLVELSPDVAVTPVTVDPNDDGPDTVIPVAFIADAYIVELNRNGSVA